MTAVYPELKQLRGILITYCFVFRCPGADHTHQTLTSPLLMCVFLICLLASLNAPPSLCQREGGTITEPFKQIEKTHII